MTRARAEPRLDKEIGMERADWLDRRVDAAEARFLMVTAITHHKFNSPIWGSREVRKLHAELAEIAKRSAELLREHQDGKPAKKRQPRPRFRGVFGAPA
jgi:hypothetical protein